MFRPGLRTGGVEVELEAGEAEANPGSEWEVGRAPANEEAWSLLSPVPSTVPLTPDQ